MLTIAFDVNDAGLRETLLRHVLVDAVGALCEDSKPAWGKMTAQQMVEHLEWAFAISNGQGFCDCSAPESECEQRKAFLYSNRLTPREFMNPLLTTGLPPLRHAGLAVAQTALVGEVTRFVDQSAAAPGLVRAHPVFGSMRLEEWTRSHYKHTYHHLLQFSLIQTPDVDRTGGKG